MGYNSGCKEGFILIKGGIKLISQIFGDFLRDLIFTPSIADQDLWMIKSDYYEGCDYIEKNVDNVIITAENPFKYRIIRRTS